MYVQRLWRPEKGLRSPGPGVVEATAWVLGTNPGLSAREALTAEPSLQPLLKVCVTCCLGLVYPIVTQTDSVDYIHI